MVATPSKPAAKPVNAAKPAAKAPAKEAKPNIKEAKPTVKEAKPAAKDAKPAAKLTGKATPPTKPPELPKARKVASDVVAKLLHLIAEEMAIEEAELTANASFREDLNLDEIDLAELLMQSERAFNLPPFEDEDWEGLETVGDLETLIEARVAAKKGRGANR